VGSNRYASKSYHNTFLTRLTDRSLNKLICAYYISGFSLKSKKTLWTDGRTYGRTGGRTFETDFIKPRPHQRQCRQKPRHCRRNPRQCCSSSTPSPCYPHWILYFLGVGTKVWVCGRKYPVASKGRTLVRVWGTVSQKLNHFDMCIALFCR